MMSKTAIYWAAGLGVVAVAAVTPAILKFYDIGWPGVAAPPPALSQKGAEDGDGEAAAPAPAAPSKAPAAAATETPAEPTEPAASAAAPVAAAPSTPKTSAAASAETPQPKPAAPAANAAPSPPTPAAVAAAAPAAPAAASPQSPQAPAAKAEAPAKPDGQRPAFDVVRVEPTGDAVIAGRAPPRAAVQLRSDGRVIAQVDADADGQFAILPPPFPAGDHRLQLAARSGGAPEVLSDAIGIEVPAPASAAPAHQSAATATPAKPAPVAQTPAEAGRAAGASPRPAEAAKAPQPEAPKVAALGAASNSRAAGAPLVSILSVEANGEGRFEAKGAAAPNALVRLYLNNAFVAEATAGADGRWSLTVERGMTPGPYAIRADEIDRANGAVSARAEVPFDYPARPTGEVAAATPQAAEKPADQAPSAPAVSPAPQPGAAAAPTTPEPGEAAAPAASANPPRQDQNPASSPPAVNPAPAEAPASVAAAEPAKPGDGANPVVPEIRTTKVVRGDNLWNLSKRFYGYGPQYKVLYEANAAQIRDPNLIYPNQIFVVPSKPKE